MSRVIAYDLCRLFIGSYFATPRGIDRVDLAVANHVFADPDGPNIGILPTPLGVRAYPARAARQLLDGLQVNWGEGAHAGDDLRVRRLMTAMRSPAFARRPHPADAVSRPRTRAVLRLLTMLGHTGVRLGQRASNGVPAGAVYVNLGQLALAMPSFFTWLHRRPDIACALMIHDTIPLDHPELVKASSVAHHARMIETAAAYADGLIFSTAFARASVDAVLAKGRHGPISSLVRSLPVPAAFAQIRAGLHELAGAHYFVAVSTIEPRKNFGLLLRIWENFVARFGARAPHLVIVGARGLEADSILAPLTSSQRLRERVHQISGLSSAMIARLVAGSAALLSPSFAEGFGLPLLEGIAMGVPTIASDIPSHREIARDTTTLLGPDDQAGWEATILATPAAPPERRSHVSFGMTEAAYCADLLEWIETMTSKAQKRLEA